MKKSRLWGLIVIMMAVTLVFFACQTDPKSSNVYTDSVMDNITNNFGQDSSRELLVQWHKATNVSTQILQIVPEEGSFDDAKSITVTGVRWNPTRNPPAQSVGSYTPRNIFKAHVTDLNPGTRYKYRVGNAGDWSETFYHLTSGGANTNFSFTVVADPQDNVFDGMRVTLRAANEFDANNRFFLIAGDISDYPQENTLEFINYTKAANEFNVRRPIAATQGNHDTYINSNPENRDHYMFGSAEVFNSFVTFPENGWNQGSHHGPHRSKSYYFYYNNVLVIMLNTFATQNPTGPSEPNHTAQANWLRQILQHDRDNKLSKYTIVVTHIPFFAGRGSSNNNEPWLVAPTREAYGKILTDFDVDILFSGHDHVYARSNPIKIGTNPDLTNINFNPTANGTIFTIASSTGPKIYTFRNPEGTTNTFIPRSYPVRTDTQAPGVF
ncbi:MAG: metallophosphoesterase family protein [Treponema sp.]|nr:metallophosphoesterase family protein [Treponema sp.]